MQLYDPETNTWASLKSMTNPRIRFEISVIDDRTYAIGGSDGMNELKSCEVFDMKTGWQPMASMHRERSNFGELRCLWLLLVLPIILSLLPTNPPSLHHVHMCGTTVLAYVYTLPGLVYRYELLQHADSTANYTSFICLRV